MALSDYRLCDVCEGKAFYDSQLSYEDSPPEYRDTGPYRIAGKPQYEDEGLNHKHGMRLGYLGDWAVLCEDCAKTYRTAILPIDAPEPSGETMRQRQEVCEAWAALPDELRKDERMTRLYRALGGVRMDDPKEAK